MEWQAILACVAVFQVVLTMGGGLIAFGSLKAELRFLADSIKRHERYIDDLRVGRGYITDPEARTVNREYGARKV